MSERHWDLTTASEVSASAPRRFAEQYKDKPDTWRFAQGHEIGETRKALAAIAAPTPSAITAVLGDGWAKPQCHWCGELRDVVVGSEFFDDPAPICLECARLAVQKLEGAKP